MKKDRQDEQERKMKALDMFARTVIRRKAQTRVRDFIVHVFHELLLIRKAGKRGRGKYPN